MIEIKSKSIVTITLTGQDLLDFSLLCKTQCNDASTRLRPDQFERARLFATKLNNYEEIWSPKISEHKL